MSRIIPPSSPVQSYVQFAALLLVVSLAGFAYLGLFGCGGSSPGNSSGDWEPKIMAVPHVDGPMAYQYGERHNLRIYCGQVGDTAATTVTLHWSPPGGATNFQFPDGREPDNIDTGPPFEWADMPWSQASQTMDVSYTAPSENPSAMTSLLTNAVVCCGPDNTSTTDTLWSRQDDPEPSASQANRPVAEAQPAVQALASADPAVWKVERWLDSRESAVLDSQSANTLIEALRQGIAFVAIKVPDGPIPADGQSAPLPLPWITDNTHPATLAMWASGGQVYKAELELTFA